MKHIHISELKPGMKIVDPGLDWIKHPYLYMANEIVESDEHVRRIAEEGYLDVYVVLDPSFPSLTKNSVLATPLEVAPSIASRLLPKVSFEEELKVAHKVHDESVAYVRKFMRDIKSGKLDMKPAADIVANIAESLERNADALISISRLRRTDSYTYMHCVNVCMLTGLLSRALQHGDDRIFLCGLAGMFHDLGKMLVPANVLNAPRKLTTPERELMNKHPELGHEQLSKVDGISIEVLLGALEHHEKVNGTGYPRGLKGEAISEIGRMIAISDIYDALTSKRVYKEAISPNRALAIMYGMRGEALHTETLYAFIRMVGVYPVGSVVEMTDNTCGVVSASNPRLPAKPTVILVRDDKGLPMPAHECDLSRSDCTNDIDHCLAAEETAIDPAQVLGIM